MRSFMIALSLLFLVSGIALADEKGEETAVQPPVDLKQQEPAKQPEQMKQPAEAKHPAEPRPPYEFVRSLNVLQDQLVQGNTAAQTALPRVIAQIGDRLLAADPKSWSHAKNARAIVAYTLSGGQIRVIRRIVQIGNSPELEKKLMEGSLAYVEGNETKAKQILLNVDARTLASSVAGHIALVQAMLIGRDDPGRSNELLDLARILSPGTLVEETALRREVFNLSESGDVSRFILLSSQYLRRFKNSVYLGNFKQHFSASIVRLGVTSKEDQFDKIAALIGDMDNDDQLRLYMLIAQAAILNGNVAVAHLASEKAIAVAKHGSGDETQARLYEAAALMLSNNYEEGLAKLKAIDDATLQKHDAELKAAILLTAKQIRQWPENTTPVTDVEPQLNPQAPGPDATEKVSADPLIGLAQKAISDTDLLLQERIH